MAGLDPPQVPHAVRCSERFRRRDAGRPHPDGLHRSARAAYAYIFTPASLLLIVVFIGANLLLWRLYRKDYTAKFSWWKL